MRLLLCTGLLGLVPTLAGCGSLGETAPVGGEPWAPPPPTEPDSIGYFLANYDKSLRRWTELKLNPSNTRDLRTLRALEASLEKRAIERQDELVSIMESGPPASREVAAVALGFTHDLAVLSTLLNGLDDPNENVVQKSLLGIGILAAPETPLEKVTYLLESDPDPWTRNNAAYAIQSVVSAGGSSPELAAACRTAVFDSEPGVRAQAASILGLISDVDSVASLGDLLHDEARLVVRAAIVSLTRLAREHDEVKGDVARLLVDALDLVHSSLRDELLQQLSTLRGLHLGDDAGPWREWAYRMP
jgi:HEAT repeat protein